MKTRTLLILLFIFGVNSVFPQALTTSLTACYSLDGNATELISNLTGTLSSATATVDRNSNANSALYFSGSSSSYVELPDNPLIKPNALSFSAWIKPVTLANAYVLFTKNTATTNIDAYSLSTVSVSTGYKFRITRTNGATTHTAECTTTLSANSWYHVAFTMDNVYLKIYVNGSYQGAVTSTVGFDYASGKKVILGGTNESSNAPFNGVIDNAKFHNRTLTASEITALYNNDFTCIPTPPPSCTDVFYTINTASALVHVSNTGQTNTSTLTTLLLPSGAQCLAIGPAFGYAAPNPTFWTVAGGTFWYYNGTGFYNTNHSSGASLTSHIGGSKNYIYSFEPSNNSVFKYNGTANAAALVTINTLTNNYVCQDIVGDENDNFYLMNTYTPQSLNVYNSSGVQTCTYAVSGIPNFSSGFAFAIVNNTVTIHNVYYHTGLINGSSITFTQASNQSFPTPADFASCSNSILSFTSSISASPNQSVSCFNPSITLTASSTIGSLSYTWSGSGISGSIYSPSVQVTSAGVYTCFLKSCLGGTSIATYTVLSDPFQLMPTAAVTNTIDCYNPFAQLSVSPNTTSNTILWTGPSIFGANNTPTITVTGGGIYTVSVSNTLNACAGTATINVFGNTAPITLAIIPSATLICLPAPTITLTVSGVADSYSWAPVSSSFTSITVNPLSSTQYTVFGNSGVCTGSALVTISVSTTPTLVNVSGNPTICSGSPSTLSLSGASNYTWMPGNLNGSSITVTPTATQVYSVTGANGFCTANTNLTVNVLTSPVVSASISLPTICVGNSSQLFASGANTYTWQPGNLSGSTITVSPSSGTVYSVTGSNTLGCNTTQTISLTVNPIPNISVSGSSGALCSGKSATLIGSGASSYTWYPGASTAGNLVVTPLVLSNYTLVGISAGCIGSASISISVNPNPTLIATANNTTVCSGNSTTLSASGALNYTWSPGAINGQTIINNPISTTNYTVNGMDANGCVGEAIVSVSVNPNPNLVISSSSPSICSGATASLFISGASSYTWNPGGSNSSTLTVNPLVSSTYSASGTNSFACISSTNISLSVISTPTVLSSASASIVCSGKATTLTATGASNYTWYPGAITSSISIINPTITAQYSVTGSNGGCIGNSTLTVTVNSNPSILVSASPTFICSGSTSTLSAIGANSYTWLPGSLTGSSASVNPNTSTIYTVTGMLSATGCTSSASTSLSVTTTPTLIVSSNVGTVCANSIASLSAAGATTYTWNPGNLSGANVTVAPSSTTTYTVSGLNGNCSDSKTISIVTNSNPTITISSSTTQVCGGNSASLTAGGALSYTWNPIGLNGSSVVVTPSTTTIYTVLGTNSLSCISTTTLFLGYLNSPTLVAIASPSAVCQGATLNLYGSGASSYFWNPGIGSTANVVLTPSASMVYTLWGSNGNCEKTTTVSVIVYSTAIVLASASPTSVCEGNTLTLNATGANNYTWNPGSFTGSNVVITPTASTIFTVIGDNTSGCINTATVSIFFKPVTIFTINNSPGSICSGNSSTIGASGAVTYSWYPNFSTSPNIVVSPSISTTYTLVGTNVFGCISSNTTVVAVVPIPSLSILPSSATICLGSTASLSANGASNYTWSPGSFNGSFVTVTPMQNTTYTVIGANGNCIGTKTVNVFINPIPTLATTGAGNMCSGKSAILSASGASTYTWNPGMITSASLTVSPSSTSVYTLAGSYTTGCSASILSTLVVVPLPTLNITSNPTLICLGATSTLSAIGATNYTWSPGNLNGSTVSVSPIINTMYTVTGSNGLCESKTTLSIEVINFSITSVSSNSTICIGETATLSAYGANNFSWTTGNLSSSISVSPNVTTTYTVIGKDLNNCEATSIIQQNVSECVGINELQYLNSTILVYPNPNEGLFTIELNSVTEKSEIEIYNSLGELVIEEKPNSLIHQVNLGAKTKGIYILLVKENGNTIGRYRIIKN